MSKTGKGLADFAISKLGTPYFYGSKLSYGLLTERFMQTMHAAYPKIVTLSYMNKARMRKQVGKVNVDCSGLIAGYRGKMLGSAQLYSTAARRLPMTSIEDFAVGTVLWKSGHVGVYVGLQRGVPMCVEAKGIDYGVVASRVDSTKWTCGLVFDDMTYDYSIKVYGTKKGINPYEEPTGNVRRGSKGNGAKWVQWELVEAGYDIVIDGDFGKKSEAALKAFQASCKITVDGICGKATRARLTAI